MLSRSIAVLFGYVDVVFEALSSNEAEALCTKQWPNKSLLEE
jgi:hypothetical protein